MNKNLPKKSHHSLAAVSLIVPFWLDVATPYWETNKATPEFMAFVALSRFHCPWVAKKEVTNRKLVTYEHNSATNMQYYCH